MIGQVMAHLRGRIGRGLLIVLPLLITLWLLGILFNLINVNVTPWVLAALRAVEVPGLDRWPARVVVPLVGVALTVVLVYAVGLLAGNLIGRRVLTMIETGILRVPVVKGVYGAARQLLDAFSLTSQKPFSRVVLIEFPRPGIWTVGFVTSEATHRIEEARGVPATDSVSVFVPTAPNPTSGWVLFVPSSELVDLDLSVEQGLKLIVSGGIVGPDDLGARVRRRPVGSSPAR